MSQGNYSEEIKEHILSEHEAGVSVRELARRYEPRRRRFKIGNVKPRRRRVNRSQVRVKWRSCVAYSVAIGVLKKSGSLVCRRQRDPAWWNRAYELIEAERKNFTIRLMCRVLEISESGYYAWRNRKPSPRTQANEKLLAAIRGVLVESGWTYGAPRIAAQLCKSGVEVS